METVLSRISKIVTMETKLGALTAKFHQDILALRFSGKSLSASNIVEMESRLRVKNAILKTGQDAKTAK